MLSGDDSGNNIIEDYAEKSKNFLLKKEGITPSTFHNLWLSISAIM